MRYHRVLIMCLAAWGVSNSLAEAGWFDDYQNLAQINSRLDELATMRPDLVTPFTIGTSYEGRDIRGIRIAGTGGTRANRPAILLNSVQHAREWISGMVNMYVADELIHNYDSHAAIGQLLDEVDVYVIPVVNPDGYEYSWTDDRDWRKNRRLNGNGTVGVDLNRNWGFGWGLDSGSSSDPDSILYRGPSPFSEPETQALRDFYLDHPNVVANIDFHSYSQLVLYPWGYSETATLPDQAMLHRVAAEMAASIYFVNGEVYQPGPASSLYLASGISIDWTYGDQGVYSYTVELRPDSSVPGFELPPNEIIPNAEEVFPAVMDLGRFTMALAEGDFNYDGTFDCVDVDALVDSVVNGTNRYEFDLNGDLLYDASDLSVWLANAGAANLPDQAAFLPGDANLDGRVDGSDFNVWNLNRFTSMPSWCSGDFNADGLVDASDFNLWNMHKFTSADAPPVVPEPSAAVLWLTAVVLLGSRQTGWSRPT